MLKPYVASPPERDSALATPWRRNRWLTLGICAALLAVSIGLYGQMFWNRFDFIQFDDHLYVFRNEQVVKGLSLQGILWAFHLKNIVAANWHPLAVISHMIDCQLFGPTSITTPVEAWPASARWHHLVALLWHSANTVMLFLVLRRMTGAVWASALAAALFCWHPLHVESVAWISERKDVLSAFFWIAGMWAYAAYVDRPSPLRYLLVATCLLLGLLSKPMVVTLPCVFLLLDYWPLRRIEIESLWSRGTWRRAGELVWEKIPLFGIVAVLAAITMYAQRAQHAVASLETIPLWVRFINVLMSYNAYIAKTIWPQTLAIPYQIDSRPLTFLQALLGGVGLVLVSVLVFVLRRRCPYWLVGWLWYIGTLVPVIGLVQVGSQAMADRYSYIPLIGIFIGIAFSLRDLVQLRPRWRPAVTAGVMAWLVVLALLTFRQVGYWKDTISLFTHTIEATKRNYSGYGGRATGWMLLNENDKAMADLNAALKIDYKNGLARHNRGILFRMRGQNERAIKDFEIGASEGKHEPGQLYLECGRTYLAMKKPDQARAYFEKAAEQLPENVDLLSELAKLDLQEGRTQEAIRQLKRVLSLKKLSYYEVLLSRIYSTHPDKNIRNGKEALRLALDAYQQTLGRNAMALDTLAAAYAELGQFDKAREHAREARERAMFDKERDFAGEIGQHYELYLTDRPLRDDMRNFNFSRM